MTLPNREESKGPSPLLALNTWSKKGVRSLLIPLIPAFSGLLGHVLLKLAGPFE